MSDSLSPSNPLVSALLTDLYQITMTYAHWKIGKHTESSVFELFFRKSPFDGQFTIFCGLDECLKHFSTFGFTKEDIDYLKSTPSLCHCEEGFFDYLANLNTSQLQVQALREGTLTFPRIPMVIVSGPLGLGQLLETTLLNLVNYPSLLTTNAARMVLRASPAPCIEFGLRRAQGPDGGCSASKYAFVGGFVATSNVQAGKSFGVPISGTHAHAYVQAFSDLESVKSLELLNKTNQTKQPFLDHVLTYRDNDETNDGELAAFVAYACAFPDACLCLIDTYDTLHSGLINFLFVAKALDDFGYVPKGIRLDSGDLASLSLACRDAFQKEAATRPSFSNLTVVVSNDINEPYLHELTTTPHGITAYGIGTNLVTCQAQPALGCVYKLVEWQEKPRIKISQDLPKVTIPGRKRIYRLIGQDGKTPLVDMMIMGDEEPPQAGTRVICRNPFVTQGRLAVTPTKVIPLLSTVFENGKITTPIPSLQETQAYVKEQVAHLDEKVKRYENPEPYDVMVSQKLFLFLHELWEREAPMEERS